jgi:hypothetical protein
LLGKALKACTFVRVVPSSQPPPERLRAGWCSRRPVPCASPLTASE